MKALMILTAVLTTGLSKVYYAQTNLICNQSFETVDATVFNKLNHAGVLYSSTFSTEDPTKSLFDCWLTRGYDPPWQSGWGMAGITYGVMPGLFMRYDGNEYLSFDHYPNTPYVTEHDDSPPRAYVGYTPADTEESGFTLSQNGDGNYGFDMSPPNTYFGENVNAPDGTNYVALVDIENSKWQTSPTIVTTLKYSLVKDVKYTVSLWYCKMNLIGQIKNTDVWNEVKEGKIKVIVCNDDLSDKQTVFEGDVNSNDWQEGTATFIADHTSSRLYIEYNPVKSFPDLFLDPKLGGAFIDNLKLYETCDTPENQCDNPRYKRDMLDVSMEQASVNSPDAYGDFRTLRLYKIDHAKYVKVYIYSEDMDVLHRTFEMYYPGTEWYWDGKDNNGVPLPDGRYKGRLQYAYNECYAHTDALEKEFGLERDYSAINVSISTNNADGNTFINGLSNAHFIHVKLYLISGQLVHEFSLYNPPSSIGLSVPSLQTYGGASNGEIAPGSYRIDVTVSNNCSEKTFGFSSVSLGGLPDTGGNSPFYNWSPVPKPALFSCPFNFVYNQDVYSPMNCCEGYLHLENMEIWNSWGEVNIQDSILIGPNVVFEPGTYNYLNAGEQIVFLPDSSGVVVLGTGVFKPNTFECEICKSYMFESVPDEEEEDNEREIVYTDVEALAAMRSVDMIVYPNPSPGDQEITVLAGTTDIDPRNYKLVLSDPLGKPVQVKVTTERTDMLRFRPVSPLSPGAYYLYVESHGEIKTFGLVIR